jgi:hypothetical protein
MRQKSGLSIVVLTEDGDLCTRGLENLDKKGRLIEAI